MKRKSCWGIWYCVKKNLFRSVVHRGVVSCWLIFAVTVLHRQFHLFILIIVVQLRVQNGATCILMIHHDEIYRGLFLHFRRVRTQNYGSHATEKFLWTVHHGKKVKKLQNDIYWVSSQLWASDYLFCLAFICTASVKRSCKWMSCAGSPHKVSKQIK